MKEGLVRSFLYRLQIIPVYKKIRRSVRRFKSRKYRYTDNTDRWYFKFLPIKRNKIVFANFAGRGYGCNPKSITEEILRQGLDWDLVWITECDKTEFPDKVRVVRFGSLESYREMATAKLWFFNIRNFPHPKKRRKQIYFQTWHGGGVVLKKLEGMIEDKLDPEYVLNAKNDGKICDYILSSDAIRSKVEREYFWLNNKVRILEYGTPRDDVFFDKKQHDYYNNLVRSRFNVARTTKIILYMPTFRDNGDVSCYNLDYYRVIDVFSKRFNTECVLFVRFHPNVPEGSVIIPDDPGIINVTSYPEAYELFLASDFSISDYNSSAICKMPLIHKPSFIFASDYNEYKSSRGLTQYYTELPIPISETNGQLIDQIIKFDEKQYFSSWEDFIKKHPSFENGTASKQLVDFVRQNILK